MNASVLMTPEAPVCGECGAALAMDAPGRICPACSLRQALSFNSDPPSGSTGEADTITELLEEDAGNPQVFGDYELVEEIARGGMGVVYKARQVSLDRLVAVKMLMFGPLVGKEFIQRFRVEASAAASLKHPNIVAVHEVGILHEQHYLVMDYIAGPTLSKLSGGQPLAPRRAAELVKTIAEAIDFAHERHVLHRDLKPSNVLVDQDGEPHVTDFGLAKRLDADSDLTLSGQVLGSPSYMSPEQASGKRGKVGRYSDVYSLGAILFHLLTGRPPFVAETATETIQLVLEQEPITPRALVERVPADLETICLKCLEKEPGRRYGTAVELAEELGRVLNDEPIRARRASQAEKLWRWCRRKPVVASLSAATAALLLAVAVGAPIAGYRINQERHRALLAVRDLRRNLYVSDMALAWQSLQDNQTGRARNLLAAYLPGAPGQEDLRGFEWQLMWQQSLPNDAQSLEAHRADATCAVFSPDGAWLATAGDDRVVIVWDVATRRPWRRLEGFDGFIDAKAVAFSPDGRWLAAKGGTKLHVWQTDNWRKVATIPNVEPNWNVNNAVAFSPDSLLLATRALDGDGQAGVAFWNTSGWQRTGLFLPHTSKPAGDYSTLGTVLSYAKDGRHLAVSDWHELQIRDGRRPAQILTNLVRQPLNREMRVLAAAISADYVAAGYRDGVLAIWKRDTWELRAPMQADQLAVTALDFSPDGTLVAAAGGDHVIRVWEVKRLQGEPAPAVSARPRETFRGHRHYVVGVSFAPNGRLLASASRDQTVKLWNVTPDTKESDPAGLKSPLGISAGGRTLPAIHEDGWVHLWDLPARRDLGPIGPPPEALRLAEPRRALSPSGRRLACVLTNGIIQIWRVSPPEPIAELVGDRNKIIALRFGPNPQAEDLLVVRSRGREVIYDYYEAGRLISRPLASGIIDTQAWNPESRFAFAPDGKGLAVLDGEPGFTLYDLRRADGNSRRVAADSTRFMCLAFSPDGALVATGEWRRPFVRFWDPQTGREQATLEMGHGEPCWLTFSPDGKTLMIGDYGDGALRFWNVALRKEILAVGNFNGRRASRLWFSGSGNALAIQTATNAMSYADVELFTLPSLA